MTLRDRYQAAAWQEPFITELGSPGERGLMVPAFDSPAANPLPGSLARRSAPNLPEVGQPQVLRHFMRLSQMTLGHNVAIDLTMATTTPKYPPIVNEAIARSPKLTALHPNQPLQTVQGLLQLMWELGESLKALSGMDEIALLAQGGAHGIYANVLIMKAYHASRGDHHRDEFISTIENHPANPAAAHAAGYKVIEVPLGPQGYVEAEALKAAVSERTAGLVINNPVDTGLYNPHVDHLARIIHAAGGLCAYDQANANATLGLTRARDAGFDLCQFNLHKTFGAPMNIFGPAAGAIATISDLGPFLPTPLVARIADGFTLDTDRPLSIGPLRPYAGNVACLIKAYAWIRALGEEGLRDVATTAVLNNNYVHAALTALRGVAHAFPQNPERRLDVVRYSLEGLREATGIGVEGFNNRLPDYGLPAAWTSHHPVTSVEPLTLEPTESFSKEELDEVIAVFTRIVDEAHTNPGLVAGAPHRGMVGQMDFSKLAPGTLPPPTVRALREGQRELASAAE